MRLSDRSRRKIFGLLFYKHHRLQPLPVWRIRSFQTRLPVAEWQGTVHPSFRLAAADSWAATMVHRPAEVVARHPPRRLAVALLVVAEAVKHLAAVVAAVERKVVVVVAAVERKVVVVAAVERKVVVVAAVERKVVVEAGLTRHQSFPCPFQCFSCCRG